MSIAIGQTSSSQRNSPFIINTTNSNALLVLSTNSNSLINFPNYNVGQKVIDDVTTYVVHYGTTNLVEYTSNILKHNISTNFIENVSFQKDVRITSNLLVEGSIQSTGYVQLETINTSNINIDELNTFTMSKDGEILYDFGNDGIFYVTSNIGIGVTNPLYQLDVSDTIRAGSVIASNVILNYQGLSSLDGNGSIIIDNDGIFINSSRVRVNNFEFADVSEFNSINVITTTTTDSIEASHIVINDSSSTSNGIYIRSTKNTTVNNPFEIEWIDPSNPSNSNYAFIVDIFGRITTGTNDIATYPFSDYAYKCYIDEERKPYIDGFMKLYKENELDNLIINCNCFLSIGESNINDESILLNHPLKIANQYTGDETNSPDIHSLIGLYNNTCNQVPFVKCYDCNNNTLLTIDETGTLLFGDSKLYPSECNYRIELEGSGYIQTLHTSNIMFGSNLFNYELFEGYINEAIDLATFSAITLGGYTYTSNSEYTEFNINKADRFLFTGTKFVMNTNSNFYIDNPDIDGDNIRVYANGDSSSITKIFNGIGENEQLKISLNNTNTNINSYSTLELKANENTFVFGVRNLSTTPGGGIEAFITNNTNLTIPNRHLTFVSDGINDGCRIGTSIHLLQDGGKATFGNSVIGTDTLNVKGTVNFIDHGDNTTFGINSDGNVGIGTYSSTAKLEVIGDIKFKKNDGNPGIILQNDGNVGIGTDTSTSKLEVIGDLNFKRSDGNPGIILQNDGNVGIGTDTPTAKLEVNGTLKTTGDITTSGDTTISGDITTSGNITAYGDITTLGYLTCSNVRIVNNSNIYYDTRIPLQVQPIHETIQLTSNSIITYTYTYDGIYKAEPSNTDVSINGYKLAYSNIDYKDYDVTYTNDYINFTSEFTITLTYYPDIDSVVDITIWPQYIDEGSIFGYSLQNFPSEFKKINNSNIYYEGNVGIGTNNPTSILHVQGESYLNGLVNTNNNNINTGTGTIITGNIGIGTDTPTCNLHIIGEMQIVAPEVQKAPAIFIDNFSSTYGEIAYPTGQALSIGTWDHLTFTEKLSINSSDQLEFNGIIQTYRGDVDSPAYSFINDGNTGIYSPGENQLALVTSGTGMLDMTTDYVRIMNDKRLEIDGGSLLFYETSTSTPYWRMNQTSSSNLQFRYGQFSGSSYSDTGKGYLDKDASGNNQMNFTGQHRTFINSTPYSEASNLEGLIVCANNNDYIKMSGGIERGINAITINESLPVVNVSSKSQDKSCFGVISASEDPEKRIDSYGIFVSVFEKEIGDTRVYINSVGEGAMWVSDANGILESGDYITTSSIRGYGMKQDSEFLANYTVAKITMDCDFNPPMVYKKQIMKDNEGNNILDEHGQIQWEDTNELEPKYKIRFVNENGDIITEEEYHSNCSNNIPSYKAAFVGCTYHCG
jgi:hypothetical protein